MTGRRLPCRQPHKNTGIHGTWSGLSGIATVELGTNVVELTEPESVELGLGLEVMEL